MYGKKCAERRIEKKEKKGGRGEEETDTSGNV